MIGSWGPLFLPLPWQAFKEWWVWRSNLARIKQEFFPVTENIVVNYFYRENPKIWTPWLVRFAYETGMKCLYSNLPSNYSLITNFREKGENYPETEGADSRILRKNDLRITSSLHPHYQQTPNHKHDKNDKNDKNDEISQTKNDQLNINFENYDKNEESYLELERSAEYFPNYSVLTQWQYDLNLRRAGKFSNFSLYFSFSFRNKWNKPKIASLKA